MLPYAQYTLVTKSNSTRSTLWTGNKVERVESDFVASVDARSSLSNERSTKSRPTSPALDKVKGVEHVQLW